MIKAVSLPIHLYLGAWASVMLILAISVQGTSLVSIFGVVVWAFGLIVHRAFFNNEAVPGNLTRYG
jgi:hypothetical protein